MVELEVARTLCGIAKNYQDAKRSKPLVANAWEALKTAEKYMFKLKIEQTIFDEMTAKTERLRLELEALKLVKGAD